MNHPQIWESKHLNLYLFPFSSFMIRKFFSIFGVLVCSSVFGQDPVTFTSLKSSGQIPEEFTQLTTSKIEAAQLENPNGLEKLNKKTRQQFYEMSNFGIADLLHSLFCMF